MAHNWRSEDTLWQSLLPAMWVFSIGSKFLCLLSHFTGPTRLFLSEGKIKTFSGKIKDVNLMEKKSLHDNKVNKIPSARAQEGIL